MLAPDDISLILESFKKFYYEICLSDKTAYMSKSFRIYPILETGWFVTVKDKFKDFSLLSDEWYISRIAIISNVVSGFIRYADVFSVISKLLAEDENKETAIAHLDALEKIIDENIAKLKTTKDNYRSFLCKYKDITDNLNKFIECGWDELSVSESKILILSENLFKIQIALTKLGNEVSLDSLGSSTVQNISNVVSTAATISYSMVVNGLSMPYLSVGLLAFYFGKTIYDIVDNAKKYKQELLKLQEETKKLNMEQKALVEIKVVLKYLYSYLQTADKQTNSIYEMISFWENEKRHLKTVRNSFMENNNYTKQNSEILLLPIADTVWQSLQQTANKIPVYLNNNKSGSDNYIEIVL